jgi:hypothetical protein
VVVDRVTGQGEHTLDAHFQLAPGPAKRVGRAVHTEFPEGGNLLVQGLGEGELSLETSWSMTGYGKKTDRPDVRFRRQGALPAVFVTLLVPYRGGTDVPAWDARVLGIPSADGVVAVEVRIGSVRDVLFAAPGVSPMSHAGFEAEGRAGLWRSSEGGETRCQAVIAD